MGAPKVKGTLPELRVFKSDPSSLLSLVLCHDRCRDDRPAPATMAYTDRYGQAAGRGVLGTSKGVTRQILRRAAL